MTTPFSADLGTYQGRIAKSGAPEGAYVYELGHALPGVVREFTDGDGHQVSQSGGSFASKTLVRATVLIRPPADVPSGMAWHFTWTVGAESSSFVIAPGRTRVRRDLAINVVAQQGVPDQTIIFALSVTGAAGVTYDAEMPSVQVDALILEEATDSPVLIWRDPEPGDIDVPIETTIDFWVTDPAGTGAPVLKTVYVDGTEVVTAGAAVGSWALSSASQDTYTKRFVLTPPASFSSSELVTVRVVAKTDGGVLDQSWSFTCVDLLAPVLVSVLGYARRQVRVQFDEPVLQVDPAGAHDALNPANYVLTLSDGAPAIVPTVVSVESLAGDVVILELDGEMTRGATYLLTIPNIADAAGNVVADPGLQGLFTGYACPPTPGRRKDALAFPLPAEVLAKDRAGTRDLERFLACLREPVEQILCDIDEWTDILDVDLAPEPFVDAMLADLGNPFAEFSAAFSLAEKRKLVKLLVPLSKLKGTDQGMINAVRILLGIDVTIEVLAVNGVWSLGDSEVGVDTVLGTSDIALLYSFYVVSPVELTDEQRSRIRKIVAYMRRAPTHLIAIKEPPPAPVTPDHWELGLSELGVETLLH